MTPVPWVSKSCQLYFVSLNRDKVGNTFDRSSTHNWKKVLIICLSRCFKMGHFRIVFFFSSFQRLTVSMFIINFCHWLHSNCGPLVLEATTLPTEPHLMARCCQTILVKYWIWSNLFCSFYPQIRNLLQHKRDRD